MNKIQGRIRYEKLLKEIPRMDCDIRRLEDQGKDTSKLEKILEDKKGKLMEMSRKIYSAGKERGLIFVVSAPSGAGFLLFPLLPAPEKPRYAEKF